MLYNCLFSETEIIEDEKALRRMNNQIHNTEMMMNQMMDEFARVQLLHASIRDKLQEEREKISQIEDALRVSLVEVSFMIFSFD